MTRARFAVSVLFVIHGVVVGTFATRLPWISGRLGADLVGLGFGLLLASVGSLAGMRFSSAVNRRFRSGPTTAVLNVMWCASLVIPALITDLVWFGAVMFLYGVATALADIAMNAQGVLIEQKAGRSVMSGLHGLWSLGALAGSGVGVLAAGLDARVHFTLVALPLAITSVAVGRDVLDVRTPAESRSARFALPARAVVPG
ncbi:hypothetical protein ACFQVD_08535 [Streptosporangium amethystogenes subsp. fukuiense]|uniref:MFS transporter n=1 Tax=Streptosporangium amethystogenes subsp. fukuiense TaxID=698418 RepID=A0ABW2SVN9_9ACTN